jgi:hypothetical protein
MKSERPIRREGTSTIRWRNWRDKQRELCRQRAKRRCEYILPHQCTMFWGLEWHHPFGRVDEPWSSHHLITTMICGEIHRRAHISPDVRNDLRWMALQRFMHYSSGELKAAIHIWEARLLFRSVIAQLKKEGVPPDAIDNSSIQRRPATEE